MQNHSLRPISWSRYSHKSSVLQWLKRHLSHDFYTGIRHKETEYLFIFVHIGPIEIRNCHRPVNNKYRASSFKFVFDLKHVIKFTPLVRREHELKACHIVSIHFDARSTCIIAEFWYLNRVAQMHPSYCPYMARKIKAAARQGFNLEVVLLTIYVYRWK